MSTTRPTCAAMPTAAASAAPHFAAAAAAIGDVGGEHERVIQTTAAGVVACDLPGTRHARPLCASRRGGCLRAGVACNDRLFGGACNGAGD